jgi:hypothetical protein
MTLSWTLDVQQGFAFTPGSHATVGHLVMATVFGTALTADLMVTDPVTNASMPAAGVLAQVRWGETAQAPLSLTACVSEPNSIVLLQLEHQQQITSTAVVLDFGVYEYDAETGAYFGSFAPAQPPLDALVGKSGNTIELQVSSTPLQVKSLEVYEVSMTVQPPVPQLQELALAASASAKIIKPWGG